MPVATLDYPNSKIAIEITNPVEEQYRAKAVHKEPWTVSFIESMPKGALLWDVGANVGPYTLIAISRGHPVVAIEPGFNNYASLCRNLGMNNMLDRCVALCCAVSNSNRMDWFHYTDARSGAASHVLGGERKRAFHKQAVMVWTWDDLAQRLGLAPEQPWYAKLDVDGGELGALKGAPAVLSRLAGLIVEMHDQDAEAITALLAAAGLRLAQRYAERDGKPLAGMAYGRFERG